MSLLGTGIIPTGAVGAELTNVTRRAFIPKMVVQLYNSTPLFAALLSNSQTAYGGVSSITAPVQGQQFVTAQWSGYDGSFNQPSVQQGAFNAEFNLKLMVTPIPFLGMEGAVQLDHTVIPLIEARMNDATNTMMDTMATALYSNTNVWWKSKVYAAGSINPTRANVLQYISGTVKNGAELPTFGVCGFGTWTLLAQDFVAQESYQITPGASFDSGASKEDGPRAAFQALMVGGIPIYADPYCPEGSLYLINSNYLNLYVHEQASFAFTGFHSTVPNFQLGYVGAVCTIAELVSVKPKSMSRVSGYNSLTL